MEASAISLESLTKFYGRARGVIDVSFDVRAGDVMGFLSPNGSGKTTVTRMLLGLISPTSGRIRILDRPIGRDSSDIRRHIGYLPGSLRLYDNMTARQFLVFVDRMRGRNEPATAIDLAIRLGLPLDTSIRSMSKGTRQKVGVVLAFMHQPRVLVLDEPTGGLDPLVQREFETILGEHVSRGAAVLLSSHVLSEVERMASHIAILDEGRLVALDERRHLVGRIERRLRLVFPEPVPASAFDRCPGVTSCTSDSHDVVVTIIGPEIEVLRRAVELGVEAVDSHEPTLEAVFVSLTRSK